jgi:ribonucleotide reductase alpha subunit
MKDKEEKTQKIYSRQDVIKASTEYFKGDTMAAEVWGNKYALKDSAGNIYELTPDDMHRRLAKEFYRIEKKYINPISEEEIFNLIKGFTYIVPQGSPMAGIGNNFQYVSISNCFVIGTDGNSDSYGGIMKTDEEQVQLMKRRGGVGHDISHIRPGGSDVKNSALTSTGIVPFMERYSNSTREVAQGGRRGALMLSVSIKHPDSEKFIDAKLEEGKATGANISVKLTDDFMKAALSGESFIQKYPIDSKEPTFTKQIDAQNLWKKIIHNAWKSAEPGILFWDTVINESIPDCYSDLGFKTISTNPCLPAEVWIMTSEGPKQIFDLIGKKYFAWIDGKQYSSSNLGFFSTGIKSIYEITTKKGLKLRGTENHLVKKIILEKRNKKVVDWAEIKNLKKGDKININNNREIKTFDNSKYNFEEGWLVGNLLGDGTFDENIAILRYWGDNNMQLKNVAVNYLINNIIHRDDLGSGEEKKIISIKSAGLFNFCKQLNFNKNKKISNSIEKTSYDFYRGFFSGWFDADGTVSKNENKGITVRLSSSDLYNLEIAQRMLLRIGIFSSIAKLRRGVQWKKMPDGKGGLKKYKIKTQHELIISKDNVLYFRDLIGFKDENKQKQLNESISSVNKRGFYKEKFIDEIQSIKYYGEDEVYDCQILGANEFDANGINVHNCGEIPLCPDDSCRLVAINLYSYVENPFTPNAKFNRLLFKEHVSKAQRFMDDIIDLELEKIDSILNKIENDPESDYIKRTERELWLRIRKKAELGRRSGLGITAEGDMLAALGFIYGTDEANNFAEEVQKTLKLEAYRSSVNLAKERGAFKIWDAEREVNNPFINRIKEEDAELYKEMMTYGRRNIALLTIAPTGSVSIMTQTTSGIEPVFLTNYMRRRKINPQEKDARVDFTDKQGDTWQEYPVFHHKFITWLEANNYNIEEVKKMSSVEITKIIEKSPYHKATSADVDWVKKVEMQGKIQKHVDHSISVTVNLPNDVTEELVAKVYEAGWRAGCKGLTVYRDGCRSGVLVSKEEKVKKTFENTARKRPKIVNADVFTFNNNYEKWVAIVGKLAPEGVEQIEENELPYEIFTGKLESFQIPSYVEKGFIIKRREKNKDGKDVSVYDFKYLDRDNHGVTMEALSRSFNEEYWNYAKLISAILRHGMPMPYIVNLVKGLKLKGDSLNTWQNGVERTFKKYIKDGTVSADVCEVCGAKLVYVEGCLKCNSCGQYSKCG